MNSSEYLERALLDPEPRYLPLNPLPSVRIHCRGAVS